MNIDGKYIFNFAWLFIISLLMFTDAIASTVFSLVPNDAKGKINCDYLEIKNNQALCTANDLIITYDLAKIKKIELTSEGKTFHFQTFTQKTIERINNLNSDIKYYKKEAEQSRSASQKPSIIEQFSSGSIPDFVQSLKDRFKHYVGNSTFTAILFVSGFVVYIIGSFGFIIAAFRVGLLWGLSCIFLPFVSFIFLFVHWKAASKPFIVLVLGIGIIFSGTMLVPSGDAVQNIAKAKSATALEHKNNGRFQCSGKIYCSEMTSCAEANYYLRNCPGTKLDGDNDGIPCEQQWCGY